MNCSPTFLAAVLAASLAAASPAQKTTSMVPMRDGIALATDVYLPKKSGEQVPAILMRTPYGKNQYHVLAENCHKHGYALVIQDMRGRFDSQGHDALQLCKERPSHIILPIYRGATHQPSAQP